MSAKVPRWLLCGFALTSHLGGRVLELVSGSVSLWGVSDNHQVLMVGPVAVLAEAAGDDSPWG